MKIKKHHTFFYIIGKLREIIHFRFNPDAPWITPQALNILKKRVLVGSGKRFLEMGSGRSTWYFAKFFDEQISVEHNIDWYDRVSSKLEKRDMKNVHLVHADKNGGSDSEYVRQIKKQPENYFDFISVDGVLRADCCLESVSKLKSGGCLMLDDSQRYIDSSSMTPEILKKRSFLSEEAGKKFFNITADWEIIITSSWKKDTALFFKK